MQRKKDYDKQHHGEIDMTPEQKEQRKIENICEMFPHVDCATVKDFYYDCGRNIKDTISKLSSIFPNQEPE